MTKVTRIGLIGDIHARDDRLEQALILLSRLNLDAVICTGDIVDGPGCPDRCISLLIDYDVRTVRGNHDRWLLQDKARHVPNAHLAEDLQAESLAWLERLPTQIEIETSMGTLLLCHGIADNDLRKVWPGTDRMPIERSHELDGLIHAGNHDLVINGHMHFKTIIHFDALSLVNAGTISGEHWPGFTTLDFEQRVIQAYQFEGANIRPTKLTNLKPESAEDTFRSTACFSGNWQPRLLFHRQLT